MKMNTSLLKVGATYELDVNGIKGTARYVGVNLPRNHCATCTCIDDLPRFEALDGAIAAGPAKDMIIIREILS